LLLISVITCLIGAIALTVGMFMHYGCTDYPYQTCLLTAGGGVLIMVGIGVGNYTKWRCRR